MPVSPDWSDRAEDEKSAVGVKVLQMFFWKSRRVFRIMWARAIIMVLP